MAARVAPERPIQNASSSATGKTRSPDDVGPTRIVPRHAPRVSGCRRVVARSAQKRQWVTATTRSSTGCCGGSTAKWSYRLSSAWPRSVPARTVWVCERVRRRSRTSAPPTVPWTRRFASAACLPPLYRRTTSHPAGPSNRSVPGLRSASVARTNRTATRHGRKYPKSTRSVSCRRGVDLPNDVSLGPMMCAVPDERGCRKRVGCYTIVSAKCQPLLSPGNSTTCRHRTSSHGSLRP